MNNADQSIISGLDVLSEGELMLSKRYYDEAYELFSKSSEINPNFIKAQYKKGTALYFMNKLDEAEEQWEKAFYLEWQK